MPRRIAHELAAIEYFATTEVRRPNNPAKIVGIVWGRLVAMVQLVCRDDKLSVRIEDDKVSVEAGFESALPRAETDEQRSPGTERIHNPNRRIAAISREGSPNHGQQ
jgi:hypothetical protein